MINDEGEHGEFKHYGKIDYEKDQLFKGLVDEINQNISNLGGYELYEHHHEQQHNSWHPLYIRRSLADILMGTKTQEEQIQKLLDDSKKIMELLIKCDNFSKLRKTYNVKMLANNQLKLKPSSSIEIAETLGSST